MKAKKILSSALVLTLLISTVCGCGSKKQTAKVGNDTWEFTDYDELSTEDKKTKLTNDTDDSITVEELQVNYLDNPIGLDETPSFSWTLSSEARNKRQIAYHVKVASSESKLSENKGDIWDSGEVRSSKTFGIEADKIDLKPATKYYVTVTVWTETGKKAEAKETTSFETGLLKDALKDAKWIGPDYNGVSEGAAPYLRTDFSSDKQIKSARFYSTAAGIYDLYLNGKRVGDTYYNPGRSEYTKYIMYQTFDVTDMIGNGANAISVVLGNGWFNCGIVGSAYSNKKVFKAKLVITYSDDTTKEIITDDSWKATTETPITENDFYDGQTYDATKEITGWQNAGFPGFANSVVYEDDSVISSKSLGEIISETGNASPVKVAETIDATLVSGDNNVFVYDMGKVIAGIPQITASAPKGTSMTITFGENQKADGMPDDTIYQLGKNTDTYTFAGGNETFTPSLTYHGFRYLKITGLTSAPSSVKGLAFSSIRNTTATFNCSNENVNKLYANVTNSIRSNFFSTITDCPSREKNGWTGDANFIAKTASYLSNVYYSYDNFLHMGRVSQSEENGSVPEIFPQRTLTETKYDQPAAWSDCVVAIPWELYNQYGDKKILSDNYDMMCRFMDYLESSTESDGYIRSTKDKKYGDHMNYKQNTVFQQLGTSVSAYSALLLTRISVILGETKKAEHYNDVYEEFKDAYQKNYIKEDGCSLKSSSQTGYVLAFKANLFEEDKKSDAIEAFKKLIKKDDTVQKCGYVGISHLYEVLADVGLNDTAYEMFLKEENPSPLYSVTQGATGIWETYEGGSANHYVLGSPIEWMMSEAAGINNNYSSCGYKNFTLKPAISDKLDFVTATYDSNRGKIASAWKNVDGGYEYNCTVPANTTATLYLPLNSSSVDKITENGKKAKDSEGIKSVEEKDGYAVITLTSGTYSFVLSK